MNHFQKAKTITLSTAKTFLKLLAPFAPHIAEELWVRLGEKPSITNAPWPTFDSSKLVQEEIKVMVQVNGKLRGDIIANKSASKEEVFSAAKSNEKVLPFLEGKSIVKEIYVPGKIVNLVVK